MFRVPHSSFFGGRTLRLGRYRRKNCLPSNLRYHSSVPRKSQRLAGNRNKAAKTKKPKQRHTRRNAGGAARVAISKAQAVVTQEALPSHTQVATESLRPPVLNIDSVRRIFLLSPANVSGIRAQLILRQEATFPLALQLREGRLTLGEAFAFISGLYFRGKLTYSRAFAQPPPDTAGALVITACGGLLPPETRLTTDALCAISSAPVAVSESRYRVPLERDARQLAEQIGPICQVVLLGSVATPKYVEPLLKIFGERLLFPAEFAGRGDMSRGGLMLRCARSGVQLTYVPVATAQRHGVRPPKLQPLRNDRSAGPAL